MSDDLSDIPAYAINNFIGERARERQRELSNKGNSWEQSIRAYLACVSFADDRIGMILDALDKSPYADNTIIVLVGDNGFHHGEKERWGKSALWREACHVPLIISGAKSDLKKSKGTCTSVVSSIDIYPTLIEACNLPKIENQLAGNSLMPVLKDVTTKWNKPSTTTFLPGNFTIHTNQWNFIKYADGSKELYEIDKDENEFINLAGKANYKAVVDSLSAFLPQTWDPGAKIANDQIKRNIQSAVRPGAGSVVKPKKKAARMRQNNVQ
jgi:arylsulfatase A-like enzyme